VLPELEFDANTLHSEAEKLPNACARAMNLPSTSIAVPVIHSDFSLAKNNAIW
jgi:hypothetical protein